MPVKVKNSVVHVSRTIKKGEDSTKSSESSESIAVHRFETSPAEVTVDYSLTVNLGNYESAKIGVIVTVPCYKEEIDGGIFLKTLTKPQPLSLLRAAKYFSEVFSIISCGSGGAGGSLSHPIEVR